MLRELLHKRRDLLVCGFTHLFLQAHTLLYEIGRKYGVTVIRKTVAPGFTLCAWMPRGVQVSVQLPHDHLSFLERLVGAGGSLVPAGVVNLPFKLVSTGACLRGAFSNVPHAHPMGCLDEFG